MKFLSLGKLQDLKDGEFQFVLCKRKALHVRPRLCSPWCEVEKCRLGSLKPHHVKKFSREPHVKGGKSIIIISVGSVKTNGNNGRKGLKLNTPLNRTITR